MKFTSARTATVVTLVDPAVDSYQPVPVVTVTQVADSYHPQGGKTRYVLHGPDYPAVTPANVVIAQASNAAAKAVLNTLQSLHADMTEQPFQVQWDDNNPGGVYDGPWWIFSVHGETESEFAGYIDVQISMGQADPADVGPASLAVQHNEVTVSTVTAMRVTVG